MPRTSRSPSQVTPEREVAGAVLDRAVFADLHEHRVEVDDRIDPIQRSRAPRGDVLQDRVGDRRDGVPADLGRVELRQVVADVADRHPAGIKPEDLLVQARQPGLALLDDLRLKRPVAVTRSPD
jgi:hypothetical protein